MDCLATSSPCRANLNEATARAWRLRAGAEMFSALHPYRTVGMMVIATDTSGNDVAETRQRVVRDGAVRFGADVRCRVWSVEDSTPFVVVPQGARPRACRWASRPPTDYPPALRASASSDVRSGLSERMDLSLTYSGQRAIVVSRG